jgi:hypothetical protein
MPADLRDRLAKLLCICGAQPDTVALFNLWKGVRSLADQPEPPGVMTVAMALMLPQVRDGSHYAQTESDVFRVDGGFVEWRSRRGSLWASGAVNLAWFDAPCTLISSQGGAR